LIVPRLVNRRLTFRDHTEDYEALRAMLERARGNFGGLTLFLALTLEGRRTFRGTGDLELREEERSQKGTRHGGGEPRATSSNA
jgi:hypothetical protein